MDQIELEPDLTKVHKAAAKVISRKSCRGMSTCLSRTGFSSLGVHACLLPSARIGTLHSSRVGQDQTSHRENVLKMYGEWTLKALEVFEMRQFWGESALDT